MDSNRFVGEVTDDAGSQRSGTDSFRLCLVVDNRPLILMEGANVIGRAPLATISIEARGVSRHHARILVSQGEATLEDLGSKNGTHQTEIGSRHLFACPMATRSGSARSR